MMMRVVTRVLPGAGLYPKVRGHSEPRVLLLMVNPKDGTYFQPATAFIVSPPDIESELPSLQDATSYSPEIQQI